MKNDDNAEDVKPLLQIKLAFVVPILHGYRMNLKSFLVRNIFHAKLDVIIHLIHSIIIMFKKK